MRTILIIGSGLTGSVLAYRHTQAGDKVTVIDRRNHIGGNVYTTDVEGICVHQYGAHIFHTSDRRVWDFVSQFVHFNDYVHVVKTMYRGKLYSLPINMHTFNEFFGITEKSDVTEEHLEQIREKLFLGYSSKQWGKSVDEIDKDVFKRIPIRYDYDDRYFTDTYQGIPVEGYTELVERLLEGSEVRTGEEVTSDYDFSGYDVIYNTGLIDKFLRYELGALEYRSLEFKTEVYTKATFQDYAVINEAMEEVPYTRTIEHKHFNDRGQSGTIITREYPKKYNGRNEAFYPVLTERNIKLHASYKELAAQRYPNMVFCGRMGSYKYYDMDDAIREALTITL